MAENQANSSKSQSIEIDYQGWSDKTANIDFFFVEKWKIASDISGSGNTANIGSITNISDLKQGNGIFSKYGEEMFDDYWMNYGKITIQDKDGKTKKITKLSDFLEYRRIK